MAPAVACKGQSLKKSKCPPEVCVWPCFSLVFLALESFEDFENTPSDATRTPGISEFTGRFLTPFGAALLGDFGLVWIVSVYRERICVFLLLF